MSNLIVSAKIKIIFQFISLWHCFIFLRFKMTSISVVFVDGFIC